MVEKIEDVCEYCKWEKLKEGSAEFQKICQPCISGDKQNFEADNDN